jgi:glycosyltransferase involved in cell wall biosynthesis
MKLIELFKFFVRKIYFFNTYLNGGAANAAINIFNHLVEKKDIISIFFYFKDFINGKILSEFLHQEHFINKNPQKSRTTWNRFVYFLKNRYYSNFLNKYLSNRPDGFEQFSYSKFYYKTPLKCFGEQPDLIHLHWITEFIDFDSFFKSIPNKTPIVWTLHDMNPFTGGCHYSCECIQYKTGICHNCPQLGKYRNGDLVKKNWAIKYNAIKNKNIHIVGNSKWTTQEAQKSNLFKNIKSFHTINLSIDLDIFKQRNSKNEIQNKYNIPRNAFIVLLGAHGISNPRKGIIRLLDNFNIHKDSKSIHLLIFGQSSSLIPTHFENLNIHLTGFVNAIELSFIYSAADIMVIPSLYESFGLTSIEAMACGTPVVAFKTGGLLDSVIHGRNGWLVSEGDFSSLSQLIYDLRFKPNEILIYGRNAIDYVNEKFSKESEKKAYLELYEKVLCQ